MGMDNINKIKCRTDIRIRYKDIPTVKKELRGVQNDKCAICGTSLKRIPKKDVCLDHDHETGRIRAVLCRSCNAIEGKTYRSFVRYGLRKRKIDYETFLKSLSMYAQKYSTYYIHPKFKTKKVISKNTPHNKVW